MAIRSYAFKWLKVHDKFCTWESATTTLDRDCKFLSEIAHIPLVSRDWEPYTLEYSNIRISTVNSKCTWNETEQISGDVYVQSPHQHPSSRFGNLAGLLIKSSALNLCYWICFEQWRAPACSVQGFCNHRVTGKGGCCLIQPPNAAALAHRSVQVRRITLNSRVGSWSFSDRRKLELLSCFSVPNCQFLFSFLPLF